VEKKGKMVEKKYAVVIGWLIVLIVLVFIAREVLCKMRIVNRYVPLLSSADGEKYDILADMPNTQAAADMLGRVNENLLTLLRSVRVRLAEGKIAENDKVYLTYILRHYDPEQLNETYPNYFSDMTSFNVDNGKLISICLRKSMHEFHDINLVMFVAIHEMAHNYPVIRGPDEDPHTDLFWYIDTLLLREAVTAGVYIPVDYRKNPIEYCNNRITLRTTPLF
jgi:hypothetical protein